MKIEAATSYPVSIFIAGNSLEAENICRDYCDEVGLCVTVTFTRYVYSYGVETGVIVGLINYPRFPAEPFEIEAHAKQLAARLCDGMAQQSYTIQTPVKTIWHSHRAEDRP
jgi:hypothetical protein